MGGKYVPRAALVDLELGTMDSRGLNRAAFEARFFGNWVNYLHKMTHAYRDMSPVNITLDLWTVFVYLVTVSSPITDRVCTHNTHTAAAVSRVNLFIYYNVRKHVSTSRP